MIELKQYSSSGKIKFIKLWVEDNILKREWGLVNGKSQYSEKICIGKNIGKSNETTSHEQAIIEMNNLITKKKKNGYTEKIKNLVDISKIDYSNFNFEKLDSSFTACKPINTAPDTILNDTKTYAQRKYNGHCLYLIKDSKNEIHVYSRRCDDISELAKQIPEIMEVANLLPLNSFVLGEFVYMKKIPTIMNNMKFTLLKESARTISTIIRKFRNIKEAINRYNNLLSDGIFSFIVFDAYYINNNFLGEKDYMERYKLLKSYNIKVPHIYDYKIWKTQFKNRSTADLGWEGYILRVPGEKSYISYTYNGKAKRKGSYKLKYVKEFDFIVISAEKGTSGKQKDLYCKFNLALYDKNNKIKPCGKCGLGTLSIENAKKITEELGSGKMGFPFVVEIKFQSIQEDSDKLEFPQILRIRNDKKPEECLYEEFCKLK